MEIICNLNREIYACVADDIPTDVVVITDKQIRHIMEEHPEAVQQKVLGRMAEAVVDPDYILEDEEPRTAVVLKCFEMEHERYRVILKLATPKDEIHSCNSIITAFYISEKKWNKYLRNKKTLYMSDRP